MRKTYAINGLIDWQTSIPVGKARLILHFTGGAMTKYGVTPAEYTTSDPLTQRVIEDSALFKSGRIYLLKSSGVGPRPTPASGNGNGNGNTNADGNGNANANSNSNKPKVMDFDCVENAAEWLNSRYNINVSKLRTPQACRDFAAKYGLTLNISK